MTINAPLRFLIDESADARVAAHLRSLGHDATTVARDHQPGLPDNQVLAIARAEGRILITDDSDFGELVFHQRHPHTGVIYFRLSVTTLSVRLSRLDYVLTNHLSDVDQFLVVTENSVRVAQPEQELELER